MNTNFFDSVDYATRHYAMEEEPEEKDFSVTLSFSITLDAKGIDAEDADNNAFAALSDLLGGMVMKKQIDDYDWLSTLEIEEQ